MTRSRDLANLADSTEFTAALNTKLNAVEASSDVTDTANVTSAGALMDSELTNLAAVKAINQSLVTTASPTFAGMATTANVTFGDNDKAVFGAGSDLEIYHQGGYSYIHDSGTGPLYIRATDLIFKSAADNDDYAKFIENGAVELYHSNSKKIETTATGVAIAGDLTFGDGHFLGDGGGDNLHLTSSSGENILLTSAGGIISFNDSSSEYARFDASGNVGIGVVPEPTWSSNNTALQIGDAGVLFASTNDSFVGLAANAYFDSTNSRYEYINTDFATLYQQLDGTHVWSTAASGSADAAITWSESMRLTSAGNFLAATTDTSLFNNTTGGGFMVAGSSGRTDMARQANVVATMNRTGNSDGDILEFRKDGSVVGSIGTNGGYIHVGSDDVNLRFHAAANAILPATTGGATRNSAIDLGTSGAKYKDLYLSGGVYLGGTGAANKISEYEIGSWTPVIKGNASGNNATMITADARYTKVGSLLYVSAFLNTINFGAITSGTHVVLTGLPYAAQADYYAPIVFGHNNTNLTDGYVETNGLVYLEINGTETQQSANAITGDRFMIGITMNLNE